jgi:hypothetical protein
MPVYPGASANDNDRYVLEAHPGKSQGRLTAAMEISP